MPNIPTGGAEMPRATMDTMVPRLEPVMRAPPLISESKAPLQAEKAKIDEEIEQAQRNAKREDRRKEERRKKKEAALVEQRQGVDRREYKTSDGQTKDPTDSQEKVNDRLGRFINIKV